MPQRVIALHQAGLALARAGRHAEALASYDAALALRPDFAAALSDRGAALFALHRHDEAIASYDRSLAIDPRNMAAHYNRGVALLALQRFDEAILDFDAALAIAPDLAPAWNNRGNALIGQRRHGDAVASLDRALQCRPDFAEALYNRGSALADLRRHDEAARDFARARTIDAGLPLIDALLLHSRMHSGDWRDFDAQAGKIVAGVRAGRLVTDPLTLLAVSDSASTQRQCAQTWMSDRYLPSPSPRWRGERYDHPRIRVAYLSADLREHPLAYLMAQVFERHDRSRFETLALAWGAVGASPMRARLAAAFDAFVDVDRWSDDAVAALLREREVDIAVDLTGITALSRPGILARRPVPVQVNYLGYPGTLGAPYIDYLIADRYVIPDSQRRDYAEQVVYLPDTFQATDASRVVGPTPARAALGLPATGMVFAVFSNSYKLTPGLFALWLRLLQQVPGSVLWLVGGNAAVEGNLQREAAAGGVARQRLVFAPRVGYAEHLARLPAADLLLDTLPFNGGATVSDALWAGLPVLTCSGEAFAARMAGSLLRAVGLPELVTTTLDEYEATALRLAGEPPRLAALRRKLQANRTTEPLFDSDRFRRHLEAAYVEMWERQRRGQAPQAFAVEALPRRAADTAR